MSRLNKKLQLNKENIASLNNMEQIYGGEARIFPTLFCPVKTGEGTVIISVYECPQPEPEKCTHSGCSCCYTQK